MGADNELAELYDALTEHYLKIPDESTPLWKTALKSVLFGDELTTDGAASYGEQQNARNQRRMKYYRSQHGDGERIRDYSTISVCPPRSEDRQYVDAGTKLPVAPKSRTVLPVHVTDSEIEKALRLLAEFPAEPEADKSGDGKPHPLDLQCALSNVDTTSSEARLLFVSDTHLGYQNRIDGSGKTVSWAQDISATDAFDTAISHAIELNVDAVVHTGDFLDHVVDETTLESASESLDRLRTHDIPFYFILGSHDRGLNQMGRTPVGINWLQEQVTNRKIHELTATGTVIPGGDLQLFGVSADNIGLDSALDCKSLNWSPATLRFQEATQTRFNVLCLHDRVTPYRSRSNADVKLSQLLDRLEPSFDCVLVGDEHRPKASDFETGYEFTASDVPVRYTGPSIPISSAYEDESAFVTEIALTPRGISSERYRTHARTA